MTDPLFLDPVIFSLSCENIVGLEGSKSTTEFLEIIGIDKGIRFLQRQGLLSVGLNKGYIQWKDMISWESNVLIPLIERNLERRLSAEKVQFLRVTLNYLMHHEILWYEGQVTKQGRQFKKNVIFSLDQTNLEVQVMEALQEYVNPYQLKNESLWVVNTILEAFVKASEEGA